MSGAARLGPAVASAPAASRITAAGMDERTAPTAAEECTAIRHGASVEARIGPDQWLARHVVPRGRTLARDRGPLAARPLERRPFGAVDSRRALAAQAAAGSALGARRIAPARSVRLVATTLASRTRAIALSPHPSRVVRRRLGG